MTGSDVFYLVFWPAMAAISVWQLRGVKKSQLELQSLHDKYPHWDWVPGMQRSYRWLELWAVGMISGASGAWLTLVYMIWSRP